MTNFSKKILRDVTDKWRNSSFKTKIVLSWLISLLLVIGLSTVLFLSKYEIHQSSKYIISNTKLRLATQDFLTSIHNFEIRLQQTIKKPGKEDSTQYISNLDSLKKNLFHIEFLLKNQPEFEKYFLPLQKIIRRKLLIINPFSASFRSPNFFESKEFKIEKDIFMKTDHYFQLLEAKEDQVVFEQFQIFNSKINKDLTYFIILIAIFIGLLTVFFLLILFDVKRRSKLASDVFNIRNELETIINTVPTLIFVKNKERKFKLVNNHFLKFFNISMEEILSNNKLSLVNLNDKWLVNEEDEAILTNKISLSEIERNIILKDGSSHWFKINKAPLLDKDNDVTGIVGVMTEITEQINFQEKLIITRKELEELNKQKDKFFSIIAHDLRSPFTGLLGFSDILTEDYEILSDEEKKFYINTIHISLKNLLELMDNLLKWSCLNLNRIVYKPEEIKLSSIIKSVFRTQKIAANSKNISLVNNCPPDKTVFGDPELIETIIRNLVSNAIKFSQNGGKVAVSAFNTKGFMKISVEDNGVGITPEIAETLFQNDKLFTTKGTGNEKGTGLGLTISKEFVKKHGGDISVKSEIGKGTTISFTIPSQKP